MLIATEAMRNRNSNRELNEKEKEPKDSKTTVIHEEKVDNTEEEMNEQRDTKNIVYGNEFYADTSEIHMNDDESFMFYRYSGEYDGDYYGGTYEAYCGQEAIDQVVSLEKYNLTQEELEGATEKYTLRNDNYG